MIFGDCERCGAVVSVADEDGTVFDNRYTHETWHAALDRQLARLSKEN